MFAVASRYAASAKAIRVDAVKNEGESSAQVSALNGEIATLKQRLLDAEKDEAAKAAAAAGGDRTAAEAAAAIAHQV